MISNYGWEFIFLGANIDAIAAADSFGTSLNYEVISETVSCIRANRKISEDWKERIDEDFKKRGSRR